jgi:hypothetical protein
MFFLTISPQIRITSPIGGAARSVMGCSATVFGVRVGASANLAIQRANEMNRVMIRSAAMKIRTRLCRMKSSWLITPLRTQTIKRTGISAQRALGFSLTEILFGFKTSVLRTEIVPSPTRATTHSSRIFRTALNRLLQTTLSCRTVFLRTLRNKQVGAYVRSALCFFQIFILKFGPQSAT